MLSKFPLIESQERVWALINYNILYSGIKQHVRRYHGLN
jgi:hypothetical protein